MLKGSLALIAAATAAFALGWSVRPRTVSAASPPNATSLLDGAPSTCSDEDALRANQNLVDQLQESKRQQMVAEGKAHLAELRASAAEREKAKPPALRSGRDEWARMAKDGKFRLRTPCTQWSDSGGFRHVKGRHSVGHRRGTEVHQRAAGAGFEEEDRELLAKAYENAHARTWKTIESACQEGPFFKEAMSESNPENDADKVAICQASLLPNEGHVRAAMRRVAESRSSGTPMPGSEPQDRVAFALSESVDVLYEEMKNLLGEEKATRALDFGVLCTNEAAYDLTEGT
jgi:hypothetical protein